MGDVAILDQHGRPIKRAYATDAFSNPVARLGFGQENLMEATRYPMTRMSWDYYLLGSLYRGNWIARGIIDVVAEDMVKNWYNLSAKLTPEQSNRISDRERRTRTRAHILDALKWGRLYGGAAAIMMIEGHDDILDEPLDLDEVMPGAYCGLMIVDRWSGIAPELALVSDPRDEAFGLPEHYRISTDGKNGVKVHQSRILRFSGRDLPYWEKTMENHWGAPELEHIFEELKKRDNTSWNIAQLVFMANLRVLKLKDMEQVLGTAPAGVQQRLYSAIEAQNRLMNSQGLHVLGAEDNFETHAYSFGGLSEIYEAFMLDISGAAGIPVTKLFGRSPAGMNATGESDMQNYYDSIEEKQEAYLRPALERLLPVLCMSELGMVPDDLGMSFNPVRRPTEVERKGLAKQTAEAVIGIYNSGLISDRVALMELKNASEATGMWGTISDEDIARASDMPQPGGEMGGIGGFGLGFQGPSGAESLTAMDAEWSESEHPRDKDGKFSGGGDSDSYSSSEVMGKEYTGVKGQAAIDKLMQEKNGHVKGAFHRADIGDIDLVWGDDTRGLQHIIKRREEQGIDAKLFLSDIASVVEKGKILGRNDRGNFEILHDGKLAVIAPELAGDKVTFLLTAFKTRKK